MVAVVLSIPTRAAILLAAMLNIDALGTNLTSEQFDAIIYFHYILLELIPCGAILYSITRTDAVQPAQSTQLEALMMEEGKSDMVVRTLPHSTHSSTASALSLKL